MNFEPNHDLRYAALLDAAAAPTKVSTYTHTYYRYPARFGESFVREAILNFSNPNETILDPFCGGGTTLVEALAQGRKAIGSDISELSIAVSKAKTTPLSRGQMDRVERWLEDVMSSTKALLVKHPDASDPRLFNAPATTRNLVASLRTRIALLPRGACQVFAKCLLLKTVQWAHDGKEVLPRPSQIVERLRKSFDEMRFGMEQFTTGLESHGISINEAKNRIRLMTCDAQRLSDSLREVSQERPSLVVTSPPYLGVHVLYNRWQLQGRKELQAPFFITDCQDIGGPSAYTLIGRARKSHDHYFDRISQSFTEISRLLQPKAYVIQLVSFADAVSSLPKYLDALATADLRPCETYMRIHGDPSWREVPGRRWYTRVGAVPDSSAAKEVLLIHRKGV